MLIKKLLSFTILLSVWAVSSISLNWCVAHWSSTNKTLYSVLVCVYCPSNLFANPASLAFSNFWWNYSKNNSKVRHTLKMGWINLATQVSSYCWNLKLPNFSSVHSLSTPISRPHSTFVQLLFRTLDPTERYHPQHIGWHHLRTARLILDTSTSQSKINV